MEINQFLVNLVIIFIPGIIALVICEKLIIHEKWNNFKFSLFAFFLGVISYLSLQAIFLILAILPCISLDDNNLSLNFWDSLNNPAKANINFVEIFFASLTAVFVGLLISFINTKNLLNEIAKKIGVSLKYGDSNLWYFYLNSKELYWVYVRDIENNLTYMGRILYFSSENKIHEIVLADVSVYSYQDSLHLYDIESIYLSKEHGKMIIEQAKGD